MKKYLAAALGVALSISLPAFAGPSSNYLQGPVDKFTAGSLGSSQASCTASGALLLKTDGIATVSVVITGTFSGTLSFKGAADENITYNSVNAYPQAGGAAVTTATSTGTWFISAAAYRYICVYMSSYTSGTATVTIDGSVALQRNLSGADLATVGSSAIALGQTTASASLPVTIASDDGLKVAQAAATAAKVGPMIQGAVTTAAPTYTTAQVDPLSLDVAGNLRVLDATQSLAIASTTAGQTGPLVQGAAVTSDPTTTTAGTYPLSMDVKGALRVTPRTRPVAYGSSPTATVAGTPAQHIQDLEGRQYVNVGHPRAINCYVATSATTSTQITGCEVVASNSIYITSACVAGDILNATATPFKIQSGTSTDCTGPHVLWSGWHPALTNYCVAFPTPIKVTVAEGLCILDTTTGSKSALISGYVAP